MPGLHSSSQAGDAGPLCVLFAATYRERTSALVLINSAPRFVRSAELPWLHTRAWVEAATKALKEKGAELVPVDTNPVDAVWPDRPEPSRARLVVQPDEFTGRNSAERGCIT